MIPGGQFTPTPLTAAFIDPLDEPYVPLQEIVPGGVGLNDPSGGRLVKRWFCFYEGGQIKVKPEGGAVVFALTVPGVLACSLGFDSNMAVTIAYQTAAGSRLYYFDSVSGLFQTLSINGATSCRACIDDPRDIVDANSDVVFAYTLNGILYFRRQRDRYLTVFTVGTCGTKILFRAGPNINYRLQFKLGESH